MSRQLNYFGRCSSDWFHFFIFLTFVILIGCKIFLSPFLDVIRMSIYGNSFFLCLARLWNSWPAQSFSLTYDRNGCNKSRINRHLNMWDLFKQHFCMIFICFFFFFSKHKKKKKKEKKKNHYMSF